MFINGDWLKKEIILLLTFIVKSEDPYPPFATVVDEVGKW